MFLSIMFMFCFRDICVNYYVLKFIFWFVVVLQRFLVFVINKGFMVYIECSVVESDSYVLEFVFG